MGPPEGRERRTITFVEARDTPTVTYPHVGHLGRLAEHGARPGGAVGPNVGDERLEVATEVAVLRLEVVHRGRAGSRRYV